MSKPTIIKDTISLDIDFEGVSKQITKYVKQAGELKITKEEDLMLATDLVGAIKGEARRVEGDRVEKTKPLNDYVKKINLEYKAQLAPLEGALSALLQAIGAYRSKQAAKIAAANEKAQEKAEKAGLPADAVALRPEQGKTIATQQAQVTFSTVWDYEVVDESKLPDQFVKRTPNLSALRAAVNSGVRDIAGVKIFSKEVPTVH